MSQAADDGGFSVARRRVVLYLAAAVLVMLTYTALYQFGMATLEGETVSFVDALHIVVETFTTTGYGEDADLWTDPLMKLLMISMQLAGVVTIFLTLPLFLVPLVEEALRTAPPTDADETGHVVICNFTPRGDTLVDELDARGVPYAIVEPDRDRAARLHADGYSVVHGDPESVEALGAANAAEAVALVADSDDETNASIILSARQVDSDLRIVSVIEDPTVEDYHRYAGADRVVSPRRLLGESLASKATASISSDLGEVAGSGSEGDRSAKRSGEAVELGDDFEIAELLVQRGSSIEGRTIADCNLGRTTGVNVIGAWFRGEFVNPPRPDDVIDEHTILLVAGRERQLEQLRERTLSETRRYRRGKVLVAGHGEVGSTASEAIVASGAPATVIDLEDAPGVDVAGDVTDRETLREAGVDEARSVVLALSDDTTAVFAALVITQIAPEVEVIARANETESIAKLYRAGAEYVLALSTVSGRLLASALLDEEVLAPESQIELVRTEAPALVGRSLADADVRARTNCTVIAAERDGELITEIGPDFVVREGDALVVAGADADVNRFNELLG